MEETTWRKPSQSEGANNCVEVALSLETAVGVRDSKDPASGHLTVAPATWSAFLNQLSNH